MKEQITAAEFRRMVISASAAIDNNKQKLNELNVFPVPDGDTGTNMSLTARAAATALSPVSPETVGEAANIAASGRYPVAFVPWLCKVLCGSRSS